MTTTDASTDAPFEYKPWFRYGHGRVYVERSGVKLGYFDYQDRTPHPAADEHLEALTEAATAWVPKSEQRKAKADEAAEAMTETAESEPAPSPVPVLEGPDLDLAGVKAGERTQAKADELGAELGWFTKFADKWTMRKTNYEAWRRGALGERIVGKELERLGSQWRVLHSVPDGNRGGDIDHLLMGPGGVFAINTKNHTRVPVKVTAGAVYVSGRGTDYLRKAREQAARATGRLGVMVFPMLCIIPEVEGKYAERGTPPDVAVVRSDRLSKWAEALIPKLSAEQVEEVYAKARRSSTWTSPTRSA